MKLTDFLYESQKVDDKYKADRFIRGWTLYPTKNLERAKAGGLLSALKVYPFKRRLKLYRGISFSTEKNFLKFLKETNNFTALNDKYLTSWTPSKQQAETFALIDDDYGTGDYAGILISMVFDNSLPAIDCTKSEEGENEIILFPGMHKIKLEKQKLL